MRKAITYAIAVSAVMAFAGCLKDKGFEDQKYGIQITEVKGVAFPEAKSSPLVVGINSQATAQVIDGPYVALEEDRAPSSPVTVTLKIDQSLVAAADPSLIALAPNEFSINSLTVTMAAGQKLSDAVKISVTNSSLLDPTKSYAVGLSISAVDQGYKIAANQKDIVIAFNIKNKYDGVYLLKGHHNRSPYNFPYEAEMEMVTAGPTSVKFFWPDAGGYGHPIGTGPDPVNDVSWYGASLAPVLVFDGTTDQITNVFNGGGSTPIAPYAGGGLQGRYDPATKTIYAYFYYYTAGGQDFSNRGWSDTLTYLHAR